jgi:PTH1 family peptidyl-tRNA hydrolase
LRPSGGTGGHHGLESVQQHTGSDNFARLRVGIGRGKGLREITGYVLGEFGLEDETLVKLVLKQASDQVECWLQNGIQKAMNNFNGMVDHPENKGTGQ